MTWQEPQLAERRIRLAYLHALLRSKRAVARLLESAASVAANDPAAAKALAEHPEALTALQQSIEASGSAFGKANVHTPSAPKAPAPPLLQLRPGKPKTAQRPRKPAF